MRHTIFVLILLSFTSVSGLSGQVFSAGLIGGMSLTDAVISQTAYQNHTWSPTKDWVAGVAFEVGIRSGFSIEADAMYRELHAEWAFVEPNGTLNSVSPANVVTWELPVLAKYHFHGEGPVRPFVEVGPSFRATGNLNFNPSHLGIAAGAGVETWWHGFRFAPTVRYTHWASDGGLVPEGPASRQDQVELLLGITRASDSRRSPLGRRVALGVLAGWGLTQDIASSTQSYTVVYLSGTSSTQASVTSTATGLRSVVAGPALEVSLPRNFSVELDALYRPLRERINTDIQGAPAGAPTSYNFTRTLATWQFPVLAKYRLRRRKANPFVEAGPAFRAPVQPLSPYGVTAGAGVEMHWWAMNIAPALRFSHWAPPNGFGSGAFPRNEAVFLLGVSFGGPRQP